MKPHGISYIPARHFVPRLSFSFSTVGLLLAAAAVSSTARAEQVVLLDLTYEATAQNTSDSHFQAKPAADTPKDLKAPTNYAGGTAYVRFESLTKPSAAKTLYNICFENPSNYACLPYPDPYTATGVYNFNAQFKDFWQNNLVDWAMGISGVQLILKDADGTKVQGDAMFYPYKMHVTITLVAPGSTYVPPDITASGGNAGAPATAGNSAAGAGGAGAGGMAAAGRGGAGAGAGASGRGGSGAGRAGAGAAGKAGAAAGSGDDGSASGAAGSIGAAGREATGSNDSSSSSDNEAGSPATPATGAPVDPGTVDPSAPNTNMNPGLGEIEQPNKRAKPPGDIEAGCSVVAARGNFANAQEDGDKPAKSAPPFRVAALGFLVAVLGGYRVRRRRTTKRLA